MMKLIGRGVFSPSVVVCSLALVLLCSGYDFPCFYLLVVLSCWPWCCVQGVLLILDLFV